MKHLRSLTLVLCVVISNLCFGQSIWDGTTVATSFQSGSGTISNPYLIYTPEQLAYFFNQVSSGMSFSQKYIKIMSDINLNQHDVHANGTFSGNLDGGNHWIQGYRCEQGNTTVATHARGCFFSNVTGVIHNLAVSGRTSGSYSIFSYARMALTETLAETGHIYNCVYNIYGGTYAAGSVSTMAGENYGTIDNCYTYGTFSTVFDGTDARAFGAICYHNMSTGVIRNCNYKFNSASYGGVFAETSQSSASAGDRKNDGLIEPFTGDEWVANHPNYDYSTWSGQYGLSCFDPEAVEQYTVTFIDELNLCSYPSLTVNKGAAIGELPNPSSEKTFMGWFRNNSLVTPTDIVLSDWTLFAKWQNCVRQQPTPENPTFLVDDPSHASFRWYQKQEKMLYDDWDSGNTDDGETSKNTLVLNVTSGMSLTFDWHVSSEVDYDRMYVSINGQQVLSESGNKSGQFSYTFTSDGEYTIVFAYSKDGSDSRGSDKVWFTNICVGYADTILLDARTSTLPEKYTVIDGIYYCVATYSDGSNTLCSDDVNIVIIPCATPNIIFADNELHFACDTENSEIHWSINAPAIQLQGTGATPGTNVNDVLNNASITITAYATAPGHGRSETATRVFSLSNFGDVNGDGEVTISDVNMIINSILHVQSK